MSCSWNRNRRYDPFDDPIRLSSIRLRAPLWWAGWRPLGTVVIAGIVGTGVGSLVATWRLRWLDTVGGGGVPVDVGTPVTYATSVFVAYAPGVVVILLFLAVGVGVWLWGCREINHRYETVIESFVQGVPVPATDSRVYTLCVGVSGGSPPLVEPRKRYVATHLLLAGDEAGIYDGSLDLARRHLRLGERVETIQYADLASVHYTRAHLELETTDGKIHRCGGNWSYEPTAALRDLRARLDRSPEERG